MNKEKTVNELVRSAETNGLIATLYGVFGKSVKVAVPFSRRTLDVSVDELDLSVRSSNALKRTGLMYVEDVVDAIADERLLQVRNLGKKSYVEIQTKMLALGYSKLNDSEKKLFFYDVLDRNCKEGKLL